MNAILMPPLALDPSTPLENLHLITYNAAMEYPHPVGRRFLAWLLDNLVLSVVSVLFLLGAIQLLFHPPSLAQTLLPRLAPGSLEALQQSLDALPHLDAQVWTEPFLEKFTEALEREVRTDLWGQLERALDPLGTLHRVLGQTLSALQGSSAFDALPPEEARQVGAFLQNLEKLWNQQGPDVLLSLIFEWLETLALRLALLPIVYFAVEALFGFSLGKLLTGVVITDLHGNRASPMRRIARWALKVSGSIVLALGVVLGWWILVAVGVGLSWVFGLSGFGAFGENAQTLYDGLSGTRVGLRRS